MAESEGRIIEEINLADDQESDLSEVEYLEDVHHDEEIQTVTIDETPEEDHEMLDASQETQDEDVVDITPSPEE